jgi:hypothetical protein
VQTCTGCGETKAAEEFGFRSKAAGRRHRKCKTCVAAYGREHYTRNHRAYIARNARSRPTQKRALKQKLWQYKSQHGCSDCGERDPLVFDFDHLDPGHKSPRLVGSQVTISHRICGECVNAYRREHYALNRVEYIARNDHLLRVRGKEWLRRLWKYLAERPCVDCGECDPVVLDCDHVERTYKRNSVSFFARSGYPWKTVLAELEKCQVRCANCHHRRTATQMNWTILPSALPLVGIS